MSWPYFVKPYHEGLSSKALSIWQHHIPQSISLESANLLLINLCLADSRILYFWQVSESIHKFIIELHILQCLFVRWSSKKQRRGLFQISQKEILFHVLYQPSDNVAMRFPFLHPSKKRLFFPIQFGQEENISGNSIESRVY